MKYKLILLFLVFTALLQAQELLPVEEAVRTTLEENFGIKVTELQTAADEMQVYKSNAGFGPIIDWNANFNTSGNNVNQRFIDDRVVNRWGRSFAPGTNVSIGLMLYDGGRAQAIYDRLQLTSEFTDLQGKLLVQNTIAQVRQVYYEIARQQETVTYLNTIIEYYRERLNITKQRWEFGKGSKLDYLQSQTDLNAQLAERARAENNLRNAKVTLNSLMNRTPDLNFTVEVAEESTDAYDLENLVQEANTQNQEVLLLQKSLEINEKQEEVLAADRRPQVNLSGAIGYNYSNNNAGFVAVNQNLFANAGVSARWNLYDGDNRKNQIAIAELNSRIVQTQQQQLAVQLLNDLTIAYNQYRFDLELLEFEEANKDIAEENLTIALEKFRLGGSAILELNEAQRSLVVALNRLVQARFNRRTSELELLRLSGKL